MGRAERCFVPLLAWVLSRWQGTQLALALDATTLGMRFTVLAISVVYRGCAIPVAWTILPANTKHAWRREWLRLLRQLRPAIPRDWTVIVLADRGLYAGWLFRRIVRLGWHPFLRINHGGTFRPDPQAAYRPLHSFAPQPGTRWRGTGTAFKTPQRRLRCTLLACWEEGYTDPAQWDGPVHVLAQRPGGVGTDTDDAHAQGCCQRDHLAMIPQGHARRRRRLRGPVQQIVICQYGIEVPACHDTPQGGDIRFHGRHPNEPRRPGVLHLLVGFQHRAQDIIGRQRLGEITPPWGEPIVHMQHVDRLPSQPPQACLHRRADRASHIVHLLRCQPHLRGHDRRILATVQGPAEDLLSLAVAIAGSHIKEVHSQLQSPVDRPHRRFLGGGSPHVADPPTATPHP